METPIDQPDGKLYRLSQQFGESIDDIAHANGIVNSSFVFVGQKLIIPGVSGPTTGAVSTEQATAVAPIPAPTTAPSSGVVSTEQATTVAPTVAVPTAGGPTPVPVTNANPATYTVQPGDNLYRIALKFNTTMAVLMQLNNISNPNLIFVGEVLKLPPGSSSAPAATPVPGQTPGTTPIPNTAGNVGFAFGLRVDLRGQDSTNLVSSIQDLGVAWVKQEVSWKLYEPTKGAIDFGKLDAVITALNTSGAKVMFTVTKAPDWARSSTTEDGPPKDFNDYANFI